MIKLKHGANSEYWKDFFEKYAQTIEEQKNLTKASNDKVLSAYSNDNYCDYYDDYYDDNDCNLSIQERAAKLWEDMGMQYDWCYAYYKTEYMRKPINISLNRWSNIQRALQLLEKDEFCILKEIMACNWKLQDVFCCDKEEPETKHDRKGLLMFINNEERIIGVSYEAIKLQDSQGNIRSFNRHFLNFNNQVLIHELD